MSLPRHHRPAAAVGAALLATLALGACSSAGGSSASAGSAVAGPVAPANPGAADAQAGEGAPQSGVAAGSAQSQAKSGSSSQNGSGTAAKPGSSSSPSDLVAADKVVRNAALTVQVDDVEAAAAESRRVTLAAGGSVLSENSTAVPRSNSGSVDKTGSRSSLTLAVPAENLDSVIEGLGKLGTVAARTSSATDVTKTYVDTQSRIATMKAGLDQVRGLLARTTDLNQIISLETEVSRRQGDLDSLQAQLNTLEKKVALSTVTLTLTTAAAVVVPDEQETGFLGGLKSGWHGFLKTGGAILTVLGAILPFLLTLALLAAPVVWWRRRRQATPATPDYAQWGPGPSGPTGPTGPTGNGGNGGNGNVGNGDNGGNGGNGGSDPDGEPGAPEPSEQEPAPVGAR